MSRNEMKKNERKTKKRNRSKKKEGKETKFPARIFHDNGQYCVCESPIPLILPVSYIFWNQQRKEEGEKEDSKKEKGRKKKIHAHKASIARANHNLHAFPFFFVV
jgi:hypothetical protein